MTAPATHSDLIRAARRALPLFAFVALPLATVTALASVTVTATALPGTLAAVYPTAIALTSTTLGSPTSLNLSASAGAVSVSDNRGSTGGTWSTTATMTQFTGVVTSTNTIPASSLTVSPGSIVAAATNPSTSSATAGGASQSFSGTVTFLSASGGTGLGTFGVNPTFTWSPPANTVAAATTGTAYTATMTFTTQ
ncbi:MAG: WxL domain-containing protein [Candidatus Dormibacteria bacterium]